MSVNLIKDWQDKTIGDNPTNNSLFNIAEFYDVDAHNSYDLIGDIARVLGYDIDKDPELLGMSYMQFISYRIAGEQIQGGSYLQTIVNYLS
tara:strand:+ start:375 stop:647 length:273 start_codon:yes stop_codon:yes gene_type:complete